MGGREQYYKEWREKNKEKVIANRLKNKERDSQKNKIYKATFKMNKPEELKLQKKIDYRKHINQRMLSQARIRARKKDLEFDLELEDIIIPNYCPILGIPIFVCDKQSDNSPSLDRVDNSKGYVKGNIIVISWRANNLKSFGSLNEFRAIVDFLEKYYE